MKKPVLLTILVVAGVIVIVAIAFILIKSENKTVAIEPLFPEFNEAPPPPIQESADSTISFALKRDTSITFNLNRPGYLALNFKSAGNLYDSTLIKRLQANSFFVDPLGARNPGPIAKIDFPGEVKFQTASDSTLADSILITAHVAFIEPWDILEPNDKPENATLVEPFKWYHIELIPETDQDYFILSVDSAAIIVPETDDSESNLTWTLHKKDGNVRLHDQPFFLESGENLLSVRRNTPPEDLFKPLLIHFRQIIVNDALEPNDIEPAEIKAGDQYTIRLLPEDVENFSLLGKPGDVVQLSLSGHDVVDNTFTEIQTNRSSQSPFFTRINETGETKVKLTAANRQWSVNPVRLKVDRIKVDDKHEPNDSISVAVDLEFDKVEDFTLFPDFDKDVFRVKAKRAQRYFVKINHASYANIDLTKFITINVLDRQGNILHTDIETSLFENGLISASLEISEDSVRYFELQPKYLTTPAPLQISLSTKKAEKAPIYVIGVEMTEQEDSLMELTNAIGANYINVSQADSLNKTLSKTVAVELNGREQNRNELWLYLLGGLVIVIGVYIGFRMKTKRAKKGEQ
ncbi:hypothetical protein [Cyclobacterium jeungdonense]|uniref:Uncharacterized protein n=1 Tax=Cyclobacterium jeungdonense TaxID=708087 RepID=A0ABT8CAR1_9BACT|nr:hypothetical protein [Cyclobacterium jeungdonense]MDN3689462.1 hypothetical protein [Cyclobacterium jeungdonense]